MPTRRLVLSALVAVAAGLPSVAAAGGADGVLPGTTERVSVASDGHQGNDISGRFSPPDVSGDGRVVAFDSQASDLVPEDGNGVVDVFVHDRTTDVTELVSVSSTEVPANDESQNPSLDANGTNVAFDSDASNLVPDDRNDASDVFVRDRLFGTTELISVNNRENQGNASSFSPDITPNGRWVAFASNASNLVRDDGNETTDVFVRDRLTGTTERVSVASDGTEGNLFSSAPSISETGRYVAFSSFANNLVEGDGNGNVDVFLRDRVAGITYLVSRSTTGEQSDGLSFGPAVSADGRYVAFLSQATNLVPGDDNQAQDVYLRDMATGTTERISVNSAEEGANAQSGFSQRGSSSQVGISADGRYVTFDSFATNLVPNDTNEAIDVFRRDRLEGTTVRVSVTDVETQADGSSSDPANSADGRVVAFISQATNLVRRDTNRCPLFPEFGACPDVFVRDDRPPAG